MRHPPAAELRHAVEQHAPVRIAGRDESGVGDAEVALLRACVEDAGFLQRLRVIQFEHDLPAAAAEAVAVGAVGVQVTAGLLLDASPVAVVERITEAPVPSPQTSRRNGGSWLVVVADAADEPSLREVDRVGSGRHARLDPDRSAAAG